MPSSSKVVPFIHPDRLRQVERLGRIHDKFCRCRTCKPPLVGDHSIEWTHKLKLALLAFAAIIAAFLVAVL